MSVPGEGRAGALIAAASRGSPIKRRSAGGGAQPSALLPCRDGRRAAGAAPTWLPLPTSAFVSSPQALRLPGLPGASLAACTRCSAAFSARRRGLLAQRCAWEQRCQPRDGREHHPLRRARLAMLRLITLSQSCQYKRMLRTQAGRGFLDACPRMGQQAGTERGQPGRVHPLLVSEEASFKRSGTTSSPPAETWASPAPWHRSCVRGCSHPFPLMWILWCVGYSQRPGPHEEGEGARRVHRGTSRHSHNKPRPLSREGSWCGWQGQGHPKPRRRCRGCHGPGEQSRGAASFPASCRQSPPAKGIGWLGGPHDAARGGRYLGLLLGTRSWLVPVPLDSDCVTLRWGQMGSEHIPAWRGWGHPGLGCPVGTCLGKQHLPSQAVIHPSSPSSNKTLWMSQGRGAGTAGLLPARGTSSSR